MNNIICLKLCKDENGKYYYYVYDIRKKVFKYIRENDFLKNKLLTDNEGVFNDSECFSICARMNKQTKKIDLITIADSDDVVVSILVKTDMVIAVVTCGIYEKRLIKYATREPRSAIVCTNTKLTNINIELSGIDIFKLDKVFCLKGCVSDDKFIYHCRVDNALCRLGLLFNCKRDDKVDSVFSIKNTIYYGCLYECYFNIKSRELKEVCLE